MFFVSFQDYTATIFLRQRWRDARLMFPGNESVSVDGRLVSLLWIPDTFIPDSKRSFLHDVTVENRLIRIFSNGTVLYALRYISLPKLWRSLTADISRCWSQTRRKQIQSTPHCSHVLYKKKGEKITRSMTKKQMSSVIHSSQGYGSAFLYVLPFKHLSLWQWRFAEFHMSIKNQARLICQLTLPYNFFWLDSLTDERKVSCVQYVQYLPSSWVPKLIDSWSHHLIVWRWLNVVELEQPGLIFAIRQHCAHNSYVRHNDDTPDISLWSLGCSSGEKSSLCSLIINIPCYKSAELQSFQLGFWSLVMNACFECPTASRLRSPATWIWLSTLWIDRCAPFSWRAVSISLWAPLTISHVCSWT